MTTIEERTAEIMGGIDRLRLINTEYGIGTIISERGIYTRLSDMEALASRVAELDMLNQQWERQYNVAQDSEKHLTRRLEAADRMADAVKRISFSDNGIELFSALSAYRATKDTQ